MLITHLAILDAGESKPHRFNRFTRWIANIFGLEVESASLAPVAFDAADVPTEPTLKIVDRDDGQATSFRWRRHAQLLDQKATGLSDNEREARHDGVRGLFAARAGALECAENHFARAAACDDIDLSAIPGFWQLDRSAMMTAVVAYERTGRIRDASALNAHIRTMYRPRSLSSVPANIRHIQPASEKVSSSS